MTPTVIFDFLGLAISIKIPVQSFYRYLIHCDISKIDDEECEEEARGLSWSEFKRIAIKIQII